MMGHEKRYGLHTVEVAASIPAAPILYFHNDHGIYKRDACRYIPD